LTGQSVEYTSDSTTDTSAQADFDETLHYFKDGTSVKVMKGLSGQRITGNAAARDLGTANLVGIPSALHGFVAGDKVQIGGAVGYVGTFDVEEQTTTNEIVITQGGGFVAETFTGNEVLVKVYTDVLGTLTTLGYPVLQGNYMYVPGWNGTRDCCLGRLDLTTMTFDQTYFAQPSHGWRLSETGRNTVIDSTGQFIFLLTWYGTTTYIYKFNLATGALVWEWSPPDGGAGTGNWCLDVDPGGQVHMAGTDARSAPNTSDGANYGVRLKHDASGNDLDLAYVSNHDAGTASCIVDEVGNYVFFSGGHLTANRTQLYRFGLNAEDEYNLSLDGAGDADILKELRLHNGFLYCLGDPAFNYAGLGNRNLFKMDKDFNVLASAYMADAETTWIVNERLYVCRDSDVHAGSDTIQVYSLDDLSLIESINAGPVQNNGGSVINLDGIIAAEGVGDPLTAENDVFLTATGKVTSVATMPGMPGTGEDEVWCAVLRDLSGSLYQFIERMQPRVFDTQSDCYFVDCGVIYDGEPTTVITGLDHLEGETVSVLADGADFGDMVVVDGAITLPETASKVMAGLKYQYRLQPMRLDVSTGRGPSHGMVKKIGRLWISFYKTLLAKFGVEGNMYDIDWRTEEAYDSPPALVTGDKELNFDGGFSTEDPIIISGDRPMPCTIRAIITETGFTD
jgi:hypothetical protein